MCFITHGSVLEKILEVLKRKFAYSSNNVPLLVLKAYTVELSSALLMSYLLSFLIWL